MDLAYYLLDRAVPRESVRVLVERKLILPGGEVVLAIIGSSHFLQVTAGGRTVTELLTSRRPQLSESPLVTGEEMAGPWRHASRQGAGTYRFEVNRRDCTPRELELETARLTSARPSRLSYTFPAGEDEGAAVTCLDWSIEGNRITVETYHTFPGEPAMVLSRSMAALPEMGVAP
jgi:hypothetical protein